MASLGRKLTTKKELDEIMNTIEEQNISDKQAKELNRLFTVFGTDFIVKKDEKGRYDLEQIQLHIDRCHAIVKKEYSARFMGALATKMMFEE